jgi:hypothetical protein
VAGHEPAHELEAAAPAAASVVPEAVETPSLLAVLSPARVLAMQRTAGNQATARFLGRGATAGPRADQDRQPGLRWHLEVEPSGVVSAGKLVTVRLRNLNGVRGDFVRWPTVTLRAGQASSRPAEMQGPPPRRLLRDEQGYHLQFKVHDPGPLEIVVDAGPAGGSDRRLAPVLAPLRLTARIDVVGARGEAAVDTEAARDEERRLDDPAAGPGARGEAFRRMAVRRAIEIVAGNLREVGEMEARLGRPETAGAQTAEVAEAVALDLRLERERALRAQELERLSGEARTAELVVPEHGTDLQREADAEAAEERVAACEDAVDAIDEARALLVEAVPALGLLRLGSDQRAAIAEGSPGEQTAVMKEALAKLRADCEQTIARLAAGRLDPTRSDSFVDRMRRELAIEADPRLAADVEAMLERRRDEEFEDMRGLFGVSLLLLLVPGVGPYLSVALGAGAAAYGASGAIDAQAAASAGVMTGPEAAGVTLDAALETIFAGVDFALALKALKGVKVPRRRRGGSAKPRKPGGRQRRGGKRGPPGQVLSEGIGPDGATIIRSRVGAPPGRKGYEDLLPPSVEVGLKGWHRAHSQGNIVGAESAAGIRYAPPEVNLVLQLHGVEADIAGLFLQKAPGVELYLTTATRAHPGTLRLKEITYRVELERPGGHVLAYEATIEIPNVRDSPKPRFSAMPIGYDRLEHEGWLKPVGTPPR